VLPRKEGGTQLNERENHLIWAMMGCGLWATLESKEKLDVLFTLGQTNIDVEKTRL
jgi:hypothetical protein